MRLIRALAAVAVLGAAAACSPGLSTVTSATISAKTAIAAIQTFNGLQVLAVSYVGLPLCTATNRPICREPGAKEIIRGASRAGRVARNALEDQIESACSTEFAQNVECNNPIPVGSYNSLVNDLNAIKDATAAYRAAVGK